MSEIGNPKEVFENASDRAEIVMTESRLSIEMILESQKDERQQMEERHARELESVRKHLGRIIFALVLTLILLVGSALGGIIYILMNYDIGVISYTQDVYADNGSTSIVEDGIHYSKN